MFSGEGMVGCNALRKWGASVYREENKTNQEMKTRNWQKNREGYKKKSAQNVRTTHDQHLYRRSKKIKWYIYFAKAKPRGIYK